MIYLIDAGHGGIDSEGNYTTSAQKGKQYTHPNFTIYEGVTNRMIAKLLMIELEQAGIDYIQIHDDVVDLSLHQRVKKANAINQPCMYLSIHSNAGKGKGFEVFTSPGETKSDHYAEIFAKRFIKDWPEYKFRSDLSDGDHDKEERFTVLTETKMPAVLVELLFFDEIKQAETLMSLQGQTRLADSLFQAIKEIEG